MQSFVKECIMLLVLQYYCYGVSKNMEKITFNHSMNNIHVPDEATYYIKKIGSLIKYIRWKTHFFLNKKDPYMDKKEKF